MSTSQIIVGMFAAAVAVPVALIASRWRKRRDPVLRALRDLRDRRGGSTQTLEEEKAWTMTQTPLRGEELAAMIDSIAVWDPVDESEPLPEFVSLDDLPPGEEREEAERLLAELRERREREVPSEARKARTGKSEVEIRAAGESIDLPFMAPTPLKPGEGIRYADGSTLSENHRAMFPEFYEDEAGDGATKDEEPSG
jgi:hypothetical protein